MNRIAQKGDRMKKEEIEIALHCLGVYAEHDVCEECPVYNQGNVACREVARAAIEALKELQQYRSMDERLSEVYGENNGLLKTLVEYILKWKSENKAGEMPAKTIMLTDEDVDRWQAYKEIGTVKECREAVEKQKPKIIRIKNWSPSNCPTCDYELSTYIEDGYYKHPIFLKRCPECGQTIQWDLGIRGNGR